MPLGIKPTVDFVFKKVDRIMYEQRERAQRDYLWTLESARREAREEGHEVGRQEGREEGRQEGLAVGKIQLLQQLLGEDVSSEEDLLAQDPAALSAMLSDLQERLRSRGL